MLNGRLYRAALLPFGLALAAAAFSLSSRPPPRTSTLAPDAFDGARAFAETNVLAAQFPDRRPGSRQDGRLAEQVAHAIEGLGGTARGGFSVHLRRFQAQTIDGDRTLTTVIAQRPGARSAPAIVILAHRDAAARGSRAELAGTAALLEFARVFSARETQRSVILVSTSGGSGGDAGASDFAAHPGGPIDAAIVLGDLASAHQREPVVVPYSDGFGLAPPQLQRTVSDAIAREAGSPPPGPSTFGQLAHLAFPFAAGEQGPLQRSGIPAVLVQASGERGPAPAAPVSKERMEGLGRGVLSAIDALDTAPDLSPATQTGLLVQRKSFPGWALRLLVGTLMLPALITAVDGLARARRRGLRMGRWTLWTLACALPFLAAALFARLLALTGILEVAPSAPVPPAGLSFDGTAAGAVGAVALALALGWLLTPLLVRRLGLQLPPSSEAAGLATVLVLLGLIVLTWFVNPVAALLLAPAGHAWLLLVSARTRPRRGGALALVAVGLLPLGVLIAFYARELGLGPPRLAWAAVLLLAGGHIGVLGAIAWSVALGCAAAAVAVALAAPPPAVGRDGDEEPMQITSRGPLSYAGPGSLGGTDSALRR